MENAPTCVTPPTPLEVSRAAAFGLGWVMGEHDVCIEVVQDLPRIHDMHPNPDVGVMLNLQEGKGGDAKPYQIRQALEAIDAHNLLGHVLNDSEAEDGE